MRLHDRLARIVAFDNHAHVAVGFRAKGISWLILSADILPSITPIGRALPTYTAIVIRSPLQAQRGVNPASGVMCKCLLCFN